VAGQERRPGPWRDAGDRRPAAGREHAASPERGGPREAPADGLDDLWPPLSIPAAYHDRPARAPGRARGRGEAGQPPRGRGRNRTAPSLSRAEIVDAAIAVADAEGSEAVSMRRVAEVLRAGTMSLYWHVASKRHLLDLMLDVLIAEAEVPGPSGDWRADLQTLARGRRAMLLRHPWALDFSGGLPPLGPNMLMYLERAMATLDGTGLDTAAIVRVLETLETYVLGVVAREIGELHTQHEQETAGITMAQWGPLRAAWRDRLAADGRFTRVVRFLDAGIDPDSPDSRDERFEFGLRCVLDGIATVVGH
jgi:AcrR family transcriptional regulator